MPAIKLILNLPWTIIGKIAVLISLPTKISFNSKPPALIYKVKSFWWYEWLPNMRGIRAMAIGNVILLSPNILDKDLEHELIHVEQAMRMPLIHPILYILENLKNGYQDNKYEKEAYEKAGNIYIEQSF